MKNRTKKMARIKTVDKIQAKNIWLALTFAAAFAALVAYATATNIWIKSNVQHQGMGRMMSGSASNQSIIAECNEMMAHHGVNQTIIKSMDGMMSGNMAQMMQSHTH